MGLHVLQNGETLAAHARSVGLSWQRIWMDPRNAELRQRRSGDPDRLTAGDQLFVPDREARWIEVAAGQAHRFLARPASEAIRIELVGPEGQPIAGGRWELETDNDMHTGATHTPIAIEGPFVSREAQLRVFDAGGQLVAEWSLRLGELPECTTENGTVLGVQARLLNLGYEPGPLNGVNGRRTQAAIRAFQRDRGLLPTGRAQDVQEPLRSAHGS